MIACPTVQKNEIKSHYDLATFFYRLLWGEHIHHGLWDADETPEVAQRQLIDRQIAAAGIQPGARVLDVGCGMGATSIYLARTLGCDVTGVTLSPLQRWWATVSAILKGVPKRTRFIQGDAEKVELPPRSFDVVWSVECTEHLFDKGAFFGKAARWLRPGGRLAICAWLAGDHPLDESATRQVYDVCEGFLCPSLGTRDDYAGWIADAGLVLERDFDWTARVTRTWELCEARVRRSGVRWLARLFDRNTVLFLDRFRTILRAYQTGAMKYGCFIARKP